MANYESIAAQDSHAHEEGLGVKRIWTVFFILLALTGLEFLIALGFVHHWQLVQKGIAVNVVYIILTLVKAYYIIAYFMHLKFEKKSFIITCSIVFILIIYFIILLLIEGDYLLHHFQEHALFPNV